MLKNLTINNVVLIDKISIDFNNGLTILSGETGSGKSILLDAVGLAIGFRSNSRLIGSLDNKATVLAEFDIAKNILCQEILQNHDINFENNQLIIRRTISENAVNKIFVNDMPISVNLLAKIGETLVEINGQHEQHGLLSPANHLEILDEFAGNQNLVLQLKKLYQELVSIDKQINENLENESSIIRERDYLEYSLNEINSANILPNEEEILTLKKNRLVAGEKINNFISDIKNCLETANSSLLQSQKILSRNQNLIDNFLSESSLDFEKINIATDEMIAKIDDNYLQIENIKKQFNNFDESKDEIEERLFLIRSLARKFNCSVADLTTIKTTFEDKLKQLIIGQDNSKNLLKLRSEKLQEYQKICQKLTTNRQKSAKDLAKKVEDELEFLKMKGTKFLVEILPNITNETGKEYFFTGNEKAKFKASLNKGAFDDINKIASGGELSRFMLAMKVALMNVKTIPTIIFDEIDTGISGSTSDAVGKRMKALANKAQILAVTHQPQIASKADHHFKIAKIDDGKKVSTKICELNPEDKVQEIARMLSGENISPQAIEVAKNLLSEGAV